MEILTLKRLEELKSNEIFAEGLALDSPECLHIKGTKKELRWVAVKGNEPRTWSIYCESSEYDSNWIIQHGHKVVFKQHVQFCMPCDHEALTWYKW